MLSHVELVKGNLVARFPVDKSLFQRLELRIIFGAMERLKAIGDVRVRIEDRAEPGRAGSPGPE
jgi:hypothetical protein